MIRPTSVRLSTAAALLVGISLSGAAVRFASAFAQSSSPGTAAADSPPAQSPTGQSAPSNAPEMATHDDPLPLRVTAELVPVRVVVRDETGKAVANLDKDDFQLLEDGKPQQITNFVVETLASASHGSGAGDAKLGEAKPGETQPGGFLRPSRFVALLFDDAHLETLDLLAARRAAEKYLEVGVTPTDRTAVYTVSGLGQLDFTDDLAKLHQTLAQLQPHPSMAAAAHTSNECPPMDEFEADKIQNQNDEQALEVAMSEVEHCDPTFALDASMNNGKLSPADLQRAQSMVQGAALRVDQLGSVRAQSVFRVLLAVVRRLTAMPGQRYLVLISPGFIYPNEQGQFSEVVDHAIRSGVFVNTLDARGLYTPDLGDITQPANEPDPAVAGIRHSWQLASQTAQTDLLASLAGDTGGYAFHGRNDLEAGLRQVASAPEAYYYLAFAPHNLKLDGKFHSIKVTVRNKPRLTVEARRGYYAPRSAAPADTAKQDIEDAVFSQEEQHGLPVALETQFYKTDAADAKLSVLARVDLAHIRFEKADGRNQNDLTVVAAVFDRNGNFIAGTQRILTMKLRDDTLARLSRTGVTVRTNFDVKPGDYVVRLVVRDSKAAQLSAENGIVQIPY
jgi:VWFA-related protein